MTKVSLALTLALSLLPASQEPTWLDYKILSEWEWSEGMKLPDTVTQWDKKKVILTGFMRREDSGFGDVSYFMLIYENCGCTGMPKMNEVVYCTMEDGVTTPIHPGPVKVTGTLYVGETKEDGVVVAIYQLDIDKVEP